MPIVNGSGRNDVIIRTSGYYNPGERCTIMGMEGSDVLAASNFGEMHIWAGNTQGPGNRNNVDQLAVSHGSSATLIGDNDRTHFMANDVIQLRIQDGAADDIIDVAHMRGTATIDQGGGSNTARFTDVNQVLINQTNRRARPQGRSFWSYMPWSSAPVAPPIPINDHTFNNVRHMTVHGSENNDVYRINGDVGNGTIDGGAGINVVVLDGNLSDYRPTMVFDRQTGRVTAYKLHNRYGNEITLTNITMVCFRDQSLSLTADRAATDAAWYLSNHTPSAPPAPPPGMPLLAMDMDTGQIGLLPNQSTPGYPGQSGPRQILASTNKHFHS